ncbi:MAG TPA: hypothetical protein EYG68_12745 [Leucothrix mucor]|nr:hypothetical protein [Leucothrix mucor]
MKKIVVGSILLVLLSNTLFAAAILQHKLTITKIRAASISAVRIMYNKKTNVSLHVDAKTKGYASCELYAKDQKGTCSVQFPGREEIVTKCVFVKKARGRGKHKNVAHCYATNLLFFFPNAKASKAK